MKNVSTRLSRVGAAVLCASLATEAFAQPTGLWMAAPTQQANGVVVQVPASGMLSRRNGLSLGVDTRWANNYGYRPIEVKVTCPKAAVHDRVITVRFHSGWTGVISAEKSFVLPGASTTASTTISMPQYHAPTQFPRLWWDVWVDGIKDKDLSIDDDSAVGGAWSGSGSGSSFLVAGLSSGPRTLVAPSTGELEALTLPLGDFPTNWIDYTCFDVIALALDELQLLSEKNPAALTAIRHWVRAGGQLWIGDVGAELSQLPDLSKRLRLSDALKVIEDTSDDADVADFSFDGWQPVRFRHGIPVGQRVTFLDITTGNSRVESDPQTILRLQNNPNFVVTNQAFDETIQEQPRRGPSDSSEWFVDQRSGLGRVRAFRETTEITDFVKRSVVANPSAVTNGDGTPQMPQSLSSAMRAMSRWEVRHGLAPDDANLDFANLLVPGVGLAPVTEFRVLITLFVLVIGPLNYWLLKRWGRLHLLVLTVPLAALLMTATLFAYAVVADGFGTAVRAHSFTTLDQRTGEAACWSRLSYYSGLAPGSGLTMPSDVVLYPIIPGWNESAVDATLGVERAILWLPEQAVLTRGWLRSRKPTQYLTLRARKSPHRLELASSGDKLRATNKLGADIQFVLVVDRAGELKVGERLDQGARAFLQPIDRTQAIRQLRKIFSENEPQPPAALTDGDSHFSTMQRRQRRQMYRGRFGLQYSQARLSDGLVKAAMDDLLGLSGHPALSLPPRSYIAITRTGPEVEFGMRGAKEVGSFHVVMGQW